MQRWRTTVVATVLLAAACGSEPDLRDPSTQLQVQSSTTPIDVAPPSTSTATTSDVAESTTTMTTDLGAAQPFVIDVSTFLPYAFHYESDVPPCGAPNRAQESYRDDGVRLVLDAETSTFTVMSVQGEQRQIEWQDQPRDLPWSALHGFGPGDVAYVAVPVPGTDASRELLAVSLDGPRAGTTLARSEPGDGSGDSDFVRAPDGWVSVVCCGNDPVLPAPDQPTVMGYVDGRRPARVPARLRLRSGDDHATRPLVARSSRRQRADRHRTTACHPHPDREPRRVRRWPLRAAHRARRRVRTRSGLRPGRAGARYRGRSVSVANSSRSNLIAVRSREN